jgi:hypothetical protein
MSSTQAGVTPVEALARPQAASAVQTSLSPAVLRTAITDPVSPTERSQAQFRLAQYRPGTTQQVRPIPVPQANVNRGGGYGGGYYGGGYGGQYGGYGYYPNQNQVSIGATISRDGVSVAYNRGPAYPYQSIAPTSLVVEIPGYGRGYVREGGMIPYGAIVLREYQWWNPGDWFLRTVG